jgi:hypothetical protein
VNIADPLPPNSIIAIAIAIASAIDEASDGGGGAVVALDPPRPTP